MEREIIYKNSIDSDLIIKISLEDESAKEIIASAYRKILYRYNGNVSTVIRELSIPRQSFYNKLRKYGIDLKTIRKR